MKYQILIHIKDDNNDEQDNRYVISFKGVFDSIKEGLDFILEKYGKTLNEFGVKPKNINNYMIITKIDTDVCKKYKNLYLSKI